MRGPLTFLLLVLSLAFSSQLLTRVYRFPEPVPFSGPRVYNPYENADFSPGGWKKANFHGHSRSWLGLTAGRGISPEAYRQGYLRLGYDIFQISDYMAIRPAGDPSHPSHPYVPCYEHGYGLTKSHQLCIGASRVDWLEFPLFQTLHHKQTVLDRLRRSSDLVAIAHPLFGGGYRAEDFRYLDGYDLVEILNDQYFSGPAWDSALSSGHAKFLVAGDDLHELGRMFEIGVCSTFVNARRADRAGIVAALRSGNAYGVDLPAIPGDDLDLKAARLRDLPRLAGFALSGDTLRVVLSGAAARFRFVGQGGRELKAAPGGLEASYTMGPDDTYVRTEILFGGGAKIYLNPVFRYSGDDPLRPRMPEERPWASALLKAALALAWLAAAYVAVSRSARSLRHLAKSASSPRSGR